MWLGFFGHWGGLLESGLLQRYDHSVLKRGKRVKRATIYQRQGSFFVHASSRTTEGVWILDNPCLKVEAQASDDVLGTAIRTALDGSRSGVLHPRVWTSVLDPLLKLAGVRSWGAFAKVAKCVEIEEEGAAVHLVPMREVGLDEGFAPEPAGTLTLLGGAAIELLGASARRVFG
jgi:hypothetical protein